MCGCQTVIVTSMFILDVQKPSTVICSVVYLIVMFATGSVTGKLCEYKSGSFDRFRASKGCRNVINTVQIIGKIVQKGGVCWALVNRSTGLCTDAFHVNMSKEECCNTEGGDAVSWTPHTVTSDVFYLNFFADGASSCQPCHKTCATVKCEPNKMCVMRQGVPKCVCGSHCTSSLGDKGKVCGTDGTQYKNECMLRKINCETGLNTQVDYYGKCRKSCRKVTCRLGSRCLEDQDGFPHCARCDTRCTRHYDVGQPVCGVDGRTYNNTCELKAAICRNGKSIRIAYEGQCNKKYSCSNFKCKIGQTCLANPDNGQPVCFTCTDICFTPKRTEVCGTDERTYASYCHLTLTSCRTRLFITTKRSGKCRKKLGNLERYKLPDEALNTQNETDTQKLKKRSRKQRRKQIKQNKRQHIKIRRNKANGQSRKTNAVSTSSEKIDKR
ncbi:follistatin-like isoform X2 [Dreissena polymorpha]|uniref:follistatin-like isoform X2 n=1 Tax=Dreissena polymorpha TaxID=45954 RepID=UPI00226523A4|nr:follistatin-like isoform X2 [Dreissena polymorpha]